ncbi:MAG: maleylpyruvate isomerase N-terminal domain-containing protein, partial [Acidimicrobiales bacterium]|nr:maleylpyruvate isomerase N-terminal domain-containing protein [Acidimicrobiales bacterium]
MDKVVAALAAQQDELTSIVSPLDETAWLHPSRCDGWSVADVVLHLAQTNEMAVASLQGRFGDKLGVLAAGTDPDAAPSVNEGAAVLVANERGQDVAAVLSRWQESANTLRFELSETDPRRRVVWVAG